MYKTNLMLQQEVLDLESRINLMQSTLNDYKYAEANYELNLLAMKAERDIQKAQKDAELWQKWGLEKHIKTLEKELEFLRNLVLEKYGHRTSNESSNEVTEPAPF